MHVPGVTPILNVSSLAESFAWFDKLGWGKLWDWGDPPDFGAVGNGPCEIFLSANGQGARGFWMSVWVADVDEVYETCQAEGLDVLRPPTDEPWGVREMHLRHPDGHVFRVSRGLEHAGVGTAIVAEVVRRPAVADDPQSLVDDELLRREDALRAVEPVAGVVAVMAAIGSRSGVPVVAVYLVYAVAALVVWSRAAQAATHASASPPRTVPEPAPR